MKKKYCKIILFILTIIFICVSSCNVVNAETTYTTPTAEGANISQLIWGNAGALNGVSEIILKTIQWGGLMILVGAIIAKGIKYVSVSPEGKAEIKKDMIMLAVGAVLLLAVTTILKIIIKVVQNAGLQ